MAELTKIQWTDHTFNPWIGCSKVHTGCANCYAEADMDHRRHRAKWGPNGTRSKTTESYWNEPLKWNREAKRDGVRRKVFCASLADVFEDWHGPILNSKGETMSRVEGACEVVITMNDLRRQLFQLIDATPNLDWLLLTKRPENIRGMWAASYYIETVPDINYTRDRTVHVPFPLRKNVWLGTSVSDQATLEKALLGILGCRDISPVLFLSMEPLLGNVNVNLKYRCPRCNPLISEPHKVLGKDGIDWVIVGGESGPNARECDPSWIKDIASQCRDAGVPCFVKQLGANIADRFGKLGFEALERVKDKKGGDPSEWPEELRVREWPEVSLT